MTMTKKSLFTVVCVALLLAPVLSFAQYNSSLARPTGLTTTTDAKTLIMTVVLWVLGFAAALAILMIIVGGIAYIVSAGNDSHIEMAKRTVIYAVIGLVVVLLSYAIVVAVSKGLGAN